MGPGELLEGDPQTWPGANKLLAAMKAAASLLAQAVNEEIHRVPPEPSNVQANVDAKQRQLDALDERIAQLSNRSGEGEVIGPAWEQRALERLFAVGVRKERELASDLGDDPWDAAAWCDEAEHAGLIEEMGSSSAPNRRWAITDKGREAIGNPPAR